MEEKKNCKFFPNFPQILEFSSAFLKKGSLEFAHICSTCGPDLPRARHTLRFDAPFRQRVTSEKSTVCTRTKLLLRQQLLASDITNVHLVSLVINLAGVKAPRDPPPFDPQWVHQNLLSKYVSLGKSRSLLHHSVVSSRHFNMFANYIQYDLYIGWIKLFDSPPAV